MIIGTTLIALGLLPRPRGDPGPEAPETRFRHHDTTWAERTAVTAPSPRTPLFHSVLVVISSMTAMSLAALLFVTVGQGGAKPVAAGMSVAAAQGRGHLVTRYREQMKLTQMTLRSLGYSPGAIDGMMGTRTSSALRAYQVRQGLRITGRLNPETRAALATEDRLPRPAPQAAQRESV
jgi:Putative peptidoglycan binding domain